MAKKIQKILTLTLVLTFVLTNTSFAQNANQSSNIQKAFENVKGQLDGLITAKDENQPDELTLRITTFEKVIDLSITEAKDLKLKLLGFETEAEDKELGSWKEKMIAGTAAALKYYEAEKQVAGEDKIIDLESIKTRAKKFKEWREMNYLPVLQETNEFFLIQQEGQAIQTAKKRAQKIGDDIKKIQKVKPKAASEFLKLLNRANQLIEEGNKKNKKAEEMFWETYIVETKIDVSSSSQAVAPNDEKLSVATTSESKVVANASSTEIIPTLSIKDLVKESFAKIKDAYQIFIEMSNLVRKLLK